MSPQASLDSNHFIRLLIDLIRAENLKPGDRLPGIRELSEKWGLGRNAVRDGLLEAQMMGLVRLEARSGAYVQHSNFASMSETLARTLEVVLIHEESNLFDLIEARRMIEVEVVKLAAERCRPEELMPVYRLLQSAAAPKEDRQASIDLDEQFHLKIAELAGNKVLLTLLRAILIMLRPFRMSLEPDQAKQTRISQAHQAIYRLLLERDGAGAQAAMNEHLSDARDRALAMLRQIP